MQVLHLYAICGLQSGYHSGVRMRNCHASPTAITSNATSANSAYGHRRRLAAAGCAVFIAYIKREAPAFVSRASNNSVISMALCALAAGGDCSFGHHADQVRAVFSAGVDVFVEAVC